MKGRDKRIVTVYLTTEQGSPITFDATLSDLENVYREAVKSNMKVLSFTYGENSTEISTKQLKDIILSGIKQYEALKLIPASLSVNKYLISNSAAIVEKVVNREQEIDRIWTYLMSTQKCNAILIGDHGVGKTTIASEIIRQVNKRECPWQFRKYHVVTLNTSALFELLQKSKFKYELTLKKIHEFVEENREKVIFYIDNLLHVKCDLLLLSYFRKWVFNYNIKFVASINYKDFNDYFEEDAELMKYLNELWVEEPEKEELYEMIKNKVDTMQETYGVAISEKMISFAISASIHHSPLDAGNPEKTIDAINFALADAKKKRQEEVKKANFFSYYKINFKSANRINEKREKLVAYHEAGHYVVGILSPTLAALKYDSISILPEDDAGGYTAYHYDDSQYICDSKNFFIDQIALSLGGRVGEMCYTKKFSAGASSDLMSANNMAEMAVLELGLAETDGKKNKTFAAMGYVKDYLLTDDMKTKINEEIEKIMKEAYEQAQRIINENKEFFEEIVAQLLEEKFLVSDELDKICKKYGIS